MKISLKIAIYIIVGIIAIQLIPVEKNLQAETPKTDFVVNEMPSPTIEKLLKNSCYDCHSNHTKYPDYASYAPISWSIASHINDGKKYVNFSEWENYNKDQKKHILESSIQLVKTRKMPMTSYVNMHPEAKISDAELVIFENDFSERLQNLVGKSTN